MRGTMVFDLIDTIPVRKRLSPSYRISRNELLRKKPAGLVVSNLVHNKKHTFRCKKKTAIARMVIRAVKSPFAYFRQGLVGFFRLFSNANGLRRGGSTINFFQLMRSRCNYSDSLLPNTLFAIVIGKGYLLCFKSKRRPIVFSIFHIFGF